MATSFRLSRLLLVPQEIFMKKSSASKKRIDAKDVKKFKEQLIQLREELLNLVQKTTENEKEYPSSEVGDSIDQAADSSARELLFEINHGERQRLEDIESALKKIEEGRFGVCENCGYIITKKRLKAVPYAHFCIKCKAKMEKPT